MNKKVLISMAFLLCIWSVQASVPITIENFSFEQPGTGKINTDWTQIPGWSSDSAPTDSGVEGGGTDGAWKGFVGDGSDFTDGAVYQLTSHVIEAGRTYTLTVDVDNSWSSEATVLGFQLELYYDDNGTRVQVATDTIVPATWATYTLSFDADTVPASIGNNLGIQFDNVSTNTAGGWWGSWLGIDNVRLNTAFVGLVNPAPSEVENVAVDTILEWTVANNWNVDVYLSDPYDDPNDNPILAQVVTDQAVTTYTPAANLTNGKWYYWRVDAYEPNEPGLPTIHEGPTWAFKTIPEVPVIVSQPQNAIGFTGDPVEFSIDVESISPEHFQWYKYVDGITDQPVGTDSNSLSVTTGTDDEMYYCVVSNDAPGSVTSEDAYLTVKRPIGWWKLDNTLDDATGNGWDGAMDDPNYVTGIDAGALDLLGTGRYMEITGSEEAFNFTPRGMTVSAWVKTAETGWGALASKADRNDPQRGWTLEHGGDTVYMRFRGDGQAEINANLTDGQWHLVVGTFDAQTGITSVYGSYVDEKGTNRFREAHSSPSWSMTTVPEMPMLIGMETNIERTDFNIYVGQIDDVRLFNYAMDLKEITDNLFYNITSEPACILEDFSSTFDSSGDCKITIDDFADFASDWLTCGLYPQAGCL